MVNIGIIGGGKIAELHAPGYLEHPDARIVAVADNYSSIAESRAEEWGADRWHTDYRALLEDSDIDGVEILTPHKFHLQMVLDALEAEKHVSVQKPMAISLAECDAIVEAAGASDKIFRVFENFKYYEPLAEAKRLLDAGEIGDPVSIRMKTVLASGEYGWRVSDRTRRWRYDDDVSGGGRVTLDYGWHIFAMGRFFLGNPDSVFGLIRESGNEDGFRVDSPLIVLWSYEGGRTHGSWDAHSSNEMFMRSDYYPGDEWFELTGTRGFIWVNRCTAKLLEDVAPLEMLVDGEMTRVWDNQIDADWGSSFKAGTKEFVDSIANGGSPGLSAEEGREVYRFVRAAQLSSRENRPVAPDEVDF